MPRLLQNIESLDTVLDRQLAEMLNKNPMRFTSDPELEELEDFHGCKWQPACPDVIYLPNGYVLKRLAD